MLIILKVSFLVALTLVPAIRAVTVIPKSAFNSVADFEKYFDYLYPWGSDHNGSKYFSLFLQHSHLISLRWTDGQKQCERRVGNPGPFRYAHLERLSPD